MKGQRSVVVTLRQSLLLWLVFVLAPSWVFAQATSTIQGHVSDPTGASVPGAAVTVTNELTGVSRSAVTAEDGYYRIPDLLSGRYRVRAAVSGFKTVVRSGIEVVAQTAVGVNLTLEVGAIAEQVTVTAEAPQVETQTTRISETVTERELKSLPMQGRGILTIVNMQPGITGKTEGGGYFCCDVFSNFAAPVISSGGNEIKANFSLDGMSLRYTEGSVWAANFSPNPDAIQELNVSTHAYSAEFGTMSGPQVQMVTKGGSNDWHGTAHYTFNQDELNALPYFFGAPRKELPNSYTRLYGATVGGPIVKDRLFIFGAYEGLREALATSGRDFLETQAFKDFVVATRPNSIAATLLQSYPPVQYANEELLDYGAPLPGVGIWDSTPDGIMDAGLARISRILHRTGNQYNVRVDYSPSSKDRIYASYWYTKPYWELGGSREAFRNKLFNRVDYVNAVHTRSFTPNTLNEARFAYTHMFYESKHPELSYNVPGIVIYDSFWMGNFAWSKEYFPTAVPEFTDIFSINRGRHGIKIGGGYRHSTIDFASHLPGDTPQYDFWGMMDFADDEPAFETRALDAETGKALDSKLFFVANLMHLFVQNTWQVRPTLTINYGVRWENFFNNRFGKGRSLWEPVLDSSQLNASAVPAIQNQKVDRYYNSDKNNFGPRFGVAWDPSGRGKISIRGSFAILYDEVNTLPLYSARENPPLVAFVFSGPTEPIKTVVYGLAPEGTRDFPPNPALLASGPTLNAAGGFVGTASSLGGFVTDLKNPMAIDTFGGVQYQLFPDFMVHASYRYKRTMDDLYSLDVNRFVGDMVDGNRDRINPNFQSLGITTNLGQRRYHGIVTGVNKRFSRGWQLAASYTYNHGTNNFAFVRDDYNSSATEVFNPDLDWARDDIAHVFSLHNVWELPILRGRSGWLAGAFGGWHLNSIWSLQSGVHFVPVSYGPSGFLCDPTDLDCLERRGDFNADGQSGERPDLPPGNVARSYTKDQWLAGAMSGDIFPRPELQTLRSGNLPRDFFRGPGYVKINVAFAKSFPIPIGRAEKAQLHFRGEAFNVLNRVSVTDIDNNINSGSFATAFGAYRMRVVQLSVKFIF